MSRRRRTTIYVLTAAVGLVAVGCLWRRSAMNPLKAAPVGRPAPNVALRDMAESAPRIDFSGRWELDREASDSLDPVLAAYGVSALERSLICNAPVTQVITQTDTMLEVRVISGWFQHTEQMPTTGQPYQALAMTGKAVESVTHWNAAGDTLLTEAWPGGNAKKVTITRTLEADSMRVETRYYCQNGEMLTCRRLFHRPPGDSSPEAAGQATSTPAGN